MIDELMRRADAYRIARTHAAERRAELEAACADPETLLAALATAARTHPQREALEAAIEALRLTFRGAPVTQTVSKPTKRVARVVRSVRIVTK